MVTDDVHHLLGPYLLQGPGRDILLRQVVPLLGLVETFLTVEGRGRLRPGLPVRAAIMQTVSDILLTSAAGSLREPLWGERDHAWSLARLLFLNDPDAALTDEAPK